MQPKKKAGRVIKLPLAARRDPHLLAARTPLSRPLVRSAARLAGFRMHDACALHHRR